MRHRPLREIALEISKEWNPMTPAAVPWCEAMLELSSINDRRGADDAYGIVTCFLNSATTWRGDSARRIKAELRKVLKTW